MSTYSTLECAPLPPGPNTTVGIFPKWVMSAASVQPQKLVTFGGPPSTRAAQSLSDRTSLWSHGTKFGTCVIVFMPVVSRLSSALNVGSDFLSASKRS